jgi:hypothetical protein
MGAVRNAAAAKPAFIRVLQNRRLAFFRIVDEGITHADVNTPAAPITDILIEIYMPESHDRSSFCFYFLSVSNCVRDLPSSASFLNGQTVKN